MASDFDMVILLMIPCLVFKAILAYPLCDSSCNYSNVTCGKVMFFLTTIFLILCGVDANVENGGVIHNCQEGTILPREPMFVEGQNLTLVCNSKKVSWKRMKFVRGSDAEKLPDKYISRINKTAIQLTFPVTEEEIRSHNKSMQYRCIGTRRKKDVCIDNVYVQLDFKPQPPTDVVCRLYDFSSINCTWSLGVNYVHRVDINCQYIQEYYDDDVDFKYKSDNPNAIWQQCPHQTGHSCIWADENFTDPLVLYVRLTVSNSRNKMQSLPMGRKFNKYDITVPGPVEELAVHKTKNPRCVTLDWTPSKAGSGRNFVYNVEYGSECSQTKSTEVSYNGTNESLEQFEICDLNPYTVYTFHVKGKIMAEKKYDNTTIIAKGQWSLSANISDRTDSDVIDVNPQTIQGLYEIDTDKSTEKEGYATVRFYWKPLPACDQHTRHDDVFYHIHAFNISKNASVEKFFQQINIPRHHDKINLSLHANNSIGGPNVSEVLTVFPTDEGPTPSELVVKYNDTNSDCKMFAIISLKDSKPVNHTVVWCKGTVNCQENIKWQPLHGNQTRYEFPKDVCRDNVRFGLITYGYRDKLGLVTDTGIRWTKCSYQIGKVPTESLPDIVSISDNRLEVQWSEYDCIKIKTYVIQYNVSYCETSDKDCKCTGKVTYKTFPRNVTKFIDDSVPDNARVCVWVTPMTSSGPAPRHRIIVQLIPSEKETVSMIVLKVIGISIGSIVGIALVVVLIVWCRNRQKKLKEESRVRVDETNAPALDFPVPSPEGMEIGEATPLYQTTNSLTDVSSGFHSTAVDNDASEWLLGSSYPAALNGYKQTEGITINTSSGNTEDSDSSSSYEEEDNFVPTVYNSVSSFLNIGNKTDVKEADMQEIDDQVDCDDISQVSIKIKPSYKDENIELSASTYDDKHLDEISQVVNHASIETVIPNDELDSEIDTANDTSCAIFTNFSGDLNGIYKNPNDINQDSGSLHIDESEENLAGNYQFGVDDTDSIDKSTDSDEENGIEDNDDDAQKGSIDEYAKCTADINEHDKVNRTKNGLNGILPVKNGIKLHNGLCKSIIEEPNHLKQVLQS